MTMVEEQSKFLVHVANLIQHAVSLGFLITGGELFRTNEQQAIYVKDGRSRTMSSNHLIRLAIDFNFFKDGKLTYDKAALQPLGDYWESLDEKNRWGGNFKGFVDTPHFERNI